MKYKSLDFKNFTVIVINVSVIELFFVPLSKPCFYTLALKTSLANHTVSCSSTDSINQGQRANMEGWEGKGAFSVLFAGWS